MQYQDLFKDGSLQFVRDFVSKVVYQGFNAPYNSSMEQVVVLVSALIVVFILYKLLWLVGKVLRFILNCLEG